MAELTYVFLFWVLGFGKLSYIIKHKIAEFFLKSKLPRLVNYLLILTPIVLIEEALTIETPYFWGIIPMLIVFYLFFGLLYLIQKYTKLDYIKTSLICGVLGWINEFILVGRINHPDMNGFILIIMSVLCILIYAVMAILPSYYIQKTFSKKKSLK